MKQTDFRHRERLRVRWAEIDAQQIVFNGHYLMYIDTAMGGYWRAMHVPYAQTMLQLGGDLYVRKATLEYHGSARYDDVLDIGMRCAHIGRSSLRFDSAVFQQDRLLVSGELVYVFADPATQTSRPVPDSLRAALNAFESGSPMLDVRVGDWAMLAAHAQALRTAVFIEEQKVPAELERDDADATAVHAVAYNRFTQPLATGRLLVASPGVAKIGRMAVAKAMRGSRVGRAVLDALIEAARARGDHEVVLHAQTSVTTFYLRAGFQVQGTPFVEAGIEHIEMVRRLADRAITRR